MSSYRACNELIHPQSQWNNFPSQFLAISNLKIQPVEFLQTSYWGEQNKSLFFTAAFNDISRLVLAAITGQKNCHFRKTKLINKRLVLELASNNGGFLFLPLRLFDSTIKTPLQWGSAAPPKSLSCPQMLNSSVTSLSLLVHTEVRKLHLVDRHRSTLALAVTWRNGSRWAGRGSDCNLKDLI